MCTARFPLDLSYKLQKNTALIKEKNREEKTRENKGKTKQKQEKIQNQKRNQKQNLCKVKECKR